jgi:hypothetical protein
VFLVWGAAGDMQSMGEKQSWAVLENKRRRLSVLRGVNRRIVGNSIRKGRGNREMDSAVRGVWRWQFRSGADVG